MTGGGSGSGISDFGTDSFGTQECQDLYKAISVLSVNSEVLSKINRGTNLIFSIEDRGSGKTLALSYEDERLGSISKYASEIIDCIERGHEYVGIVSSIDGGNCVIEARKTSENV